ncbi:hypothetical protein ABZ848_13170 [Streptomyces sp. NPDC047081]|uniref:NACHT and WD40 repeat domain-containing protein n=1 Tax=Streptomyces sp. NPDC047081 TaxID=3154706 RepID=UPI0033CA4996
MRLDGRLDGRFDRSIEQLAHGYSRLEHGRLVAIGEPGAGKTVLAILLTLGLLGAREQGGRVPVLLPVSSWDPLRERLDDWIVRTLAVPYYGGDPEIPRILLSHGLLLPVLDGLDEIPESARRGAIRGINQAIGADRPAVVTCRAVEYEELIRGGAPRLRQAPVVEVLPVSPDDVIGYLREAAWPAGVDWSGVFERLRNERPGPLAEALSTPLMVTTARLVYQRGGREPAELLDEDRFDCRYAVEDHLTHQVVEAVYAGGEERERGRWSPEQARRWLTFLASHLHEHRERDLAWWLLGGRLLPVWVGPVITLVVGLLLAGVAVLWVWATAGFAADPPFGYIVAWALGSAGLFALVASILWYAAGSPLPGRLSWSPSGSAGRLRRGFRSGAVLSAAFVVPIASGVTLVVVVGTTLGPGTLQGAEDLAKLLTVCAALSFVTGLALAAHGWLNAPPSRAAQVSAANSVAQDRRSALAGALVAGVVFGITAMYGLWAGLSAGGLLFRWCTGWPGWPGDAETGAYLRAEWARSDHAYHAGGYGPGPSMLLPGTVFAIFVFLTRAWPRFVLARWWLAARGRLPWRLLDFLEDVRQREILRQSSGTYQFRHIRLQEALAGQPVGENRPSRTPGWTEPEGIRRRVVLTAGLTAALAGAGAGVAHQQDESRTVFADPSGQAVTAVAFRPGIRQNQLVWATSDGRVWWGSVLSGSRLVGVSDQRVLPEGKYRHSTVRALAFDPDGSVLAVARGKKVELWDVGQREPVFRGRWKTGAVHFLAFHPQGRYLAGTYYDDDFSDPSTGYIVGRVGDHGLPETLKRIGSTDPNLGAVSFLSQDELLVRDEEMGVSAYRAPEFRKSNRQLLATGQLSADSDHPDGVLAGPRGDCLYVTGSRNGLWQLGAGNEWHEEAGEMPFSSAAAFHPSQAVLAFAPTGDVYGSRADGTIQVWSTDAIPSYVRTLHGHMDEVTAMDFSPDGSLLVTAGVDGTVRLWTGVA